jgi:hypothetical protein
MYINAIVAPEINPFLFIFNVLNVLPINILRDVIIVVTTGIVFSCSLVYVSRIENIIKHTTVNKIEIKTLFNIFFKSNHFSSIVKPPITT